MTLTRITSDGITDGTITGTDLATNIDLVDNQKLRLGTGNDLQIYHDGSHSRVVDTGTGNLILQGSIVNFQNVAGTENMIKATENGSVELYYDNSTKFETVTGGATITGVCTATSFAGDGSSLSGINTDLVSDTSPQLGGNLDTNGNVVIFPDSNGTTNRLLFGTNKFQMYYDSGNSRMQIDNITGDFTIRNQASGGDIDIIAGDDIRIRPQGGENGINLVGNGTVELYYDNVLKFKTVSGGVRTNGNLELLDNHEIQVGSGADLKIYHDGNHSYINDSGSGLIKVVTSGFQVRNAADDETLIYAVQNGSVSLYHDNSKKFETDNIGVKLEDNNHVSFGTGSDFKIHFDGSNAYLDANAGNVYFRGNSNEAMLQLHQNGAVELYHNGSKKVETNAGGLKFNSGSGNLISYGTTSEFPNAAINIYRGGNGYANIRLSSNYGCGLYMAGANDNTDEFGINQDNQKIGYLDNRGGAIKITTGSSALTRLTFENSYTITSVCDFVPSSNNAKDLGTTSLRWRNIYTNDLNLSNEGGANDVDNTWGDYTIQEGESNLFLINNRNGKKYKFNLTEVS